MLQEYYIQRRGEAILLKMAVESAVLDVVTDEKLLHESLAALDASHHGLVDVPFGRFGPFGVRLNIHSDDSLSIFADGPEFDPPMEQSAAIWISKEEIRRVINDALSG